MDEPRLASDGFDGAVVVGGKRRWYRPYRQDRGPALGADEVTLWGSTGVLVSAPLIESGIHYRIAGDGEGGAIVGWFDGLGTIWTQRLSFLGVKLWGSTGAEFGIPASSFSYVPDLQANQPLHRVLA